MATRNDGDGCRACRHRGDHNNRHDWMTCSLKGSLVHVSWTCERFERLPDV